jgi:FkbH-like protein
MQATALPWLPELPDLAQRIAQARKDSPGFAGLAALANARLNYLRTEQLDRLLAAACPAAPDAGLAAEPIRLALLGSSTTKHLHAGIRVAALRRHLYVEIYEPDYGQYSAELQDAHSGLHAFRPNVVLFALDARHLTRQFAAGQDQAAAGQALAATLAELGQGWARARAAFDATVLQQTALPIFPELMGQNEHLLPGSPAHAVRALNAALRGAAAAAGVSLVAVDAACAGAGMDAWYSETFWHQAKQEIFATAAPFYGELVMRMIAARYGRSAKCLVLDLDNTIWGGVVGDDGVQGLALGQGSAEGEAFVAFQRYALDLSKRGVILAVCSKNDEANALAPFETHPDMVLKRSDIACFIANWDDKATNLRKIAQSLNIGLDALVFVDDNPFERNLVRGALPMVAVPEIPEEPALVARCIADAGYFEAIALTDEDWARTAQYQQNAARAGLAASVTDLGGYLASLDMVLVWNYFDEIGRARITQLINKTNQFNLTTRRYSEDEVAALMADQSVLGLQFRLKDRFGDNGMIAVVIARLSGEDAIIDSWLMSCRVLGRQVEEATLAVLAREAGRRGAARLLGEYRETAKNGMVARHYEKLGFAPANGAETGRFVLALADYSQPALPMLIEQTGVAEGAAPAEMMETAP